MACGKACERCEQRMVCSESAEHAELERIVAARRAKVKPLAWAVQLQGNVYVFGIN